MEVKRAESYIRHQVKCPSLFTNPNRS